ncbi:hypothetical protein K402DRAFT_326218, partial [Aulographum hederae CBS 113979]
TLNRQNKHFSIPRLLNTLFTGRTDVTDIICKALTPIETNDTEQQRIFVITGMGGMGKSEICIKVANLLRQKYWGVFWIDLSNPSTAEAELIAVAKKLGRTVDKLSDARDVLASTNKSCLLILDNADDPDFDYGPFFPQMTRGAIIMTTRIYECAASYNTVGSEELEGLDPTCSSHLLLSAAKIPEESWSSYHDSAMKIVELLGSHTLALIQAGAYIANGHSTIAEYPAKYETQRKRLLEFLPKQARSRYAGVYATFEASAKVLETNDDGGSKDALALLNVLSMLHFGFLPMVLFEKAWEKSRELLNRNVDLTIVDGEPNQWHTRQVPDFMQMQAEEWDAFRLTRAISLLASLSLITTHKSDDTLTGISMHPVAHAWAKDRQKLDVQQQSWISVGCILASNDYDVWVRQERQLRPHVLAYLGDAQAWITSAHNLLGENVKGTLVPSMLQIGWGLQTWRQDQQLRAFLGDLFGAFNLSEEIPLENWMPLYDLKAKSFLDENHQKAIGLLQKIDEIKSSQLEPNDLSRLETQSSLGWVYVANGQAQMGIKLLKDVLEIRRKFQDEDSSEILEAHRYLGYAYLENHQMHEAIGSLEHVVSIRKVTLEEDHAVLLASQHVLAGAYLDDGQVTEAIDLLEHVVKIRKRSLEESHPDLLISQHVLARAYLDDRQVTAAIDLLDHVVMIKKRSLEERHPELLVSEHVLARAYFKNKQVLEAVKLEEQVVKVWQMTVSEKHRGRVISENNLAIYRERLALQEDFQGGGEDLSDGDGNVDSNSYGNILGDDIEIADADAGGEDRDETPDPEYRPNKRKRMADADAGGKDRDETLDQKTGLIRG